MSVATRESIAELFIAFFDRAPAAEGLDYWLNDSGLELEQISESFFDQVETQTRYPDTMSDSDFVNQIFLNVFDRPAQPDGLTYWVDELQSGSITRSNMVLAIANGASSVADQAILDNKTEVGLYFADSIEGYIYDPAAAPEGQDAYDVMQGVTADDATVAAAKIEIDDWATENSTEDFTTERDTLPPTDDDAIYSGTETGNAATTTYQAVDAADGGDGEDTLHITATAAATTATGAALITNIETLHVTQNGGAAGTTLRVDATNFDDSFTNIVVDGSATALGAVQIGVAAGSRLDAIVDDVQLSGNNVAQTVNVRYEAAATASTADIAGVTLTNSVAQTFTSAGIETYNVHTGSGAQTLSIADNTATTITVDGAANLNLTDAAAVRVATVDASAASGALTFADAVGAGVTIIGGLAADTLTGGAGIDRLQGNAGADNLDGLGGADIYSYASHTDSISTSMDIVNFAGADIINVTEAIRTDGGVGTDALIVTTDFVVGAAPLAEGAAYVAAGVEGVTHAYTNGNILYVDVNQDNKFNAADDLVINTTVTVTSGDLIV